MCYPDMPKKYTWNDKDCKWTTRKAHFNTLGRLHTVSPSETERFHLRILLQNVASPTSFADLKTVNGIVYQTYARACLERGLIRDDSEYENCLKESALFKFPRALRGLFVTILTQCSPSKPECLWETFKDDLSEDFKRNCDKKTAHKLAYISINRLLLEVGKSLADYKSMPECEDDGTAALEDIVSMEEARILVEEAAKKMTKRQKKVFKAIKRALDGKPGASKCQFLDGPAGTGKSFVFRAIYSLAVALGKKATCVAFMGIAATNLPRGKTVHKVFGLPVPVYKDSQSYIELRTKQAEELRSTEIFLWDEAPSAPRYALEIADRKLREIMGNDKPFGGKCIFLAGDFRQTLPIQEGATRAETVDLTISSSPLWKHFRSYRLKENMRAGREEKQFAKKLLKIGNGDLNDENDCIRLPSKTLTKELLAEEVFGKPLRDSDFETLGTRAILAPLNAQVDEINVEVMELLPGEPKVYTGIDETDASHTEFSTEVLNTVKLPGLPHHRIVLKQNATVMLMRNLNVQNGQCNGTRMRVVQMADHVLRCRILTGDKCGEEVFLPRITLNEDKFIVPFRRHQFPIRIAYGMTLNRCQGQTLDVVGLDLRHQAFAHGQTYVGISRVRSWDSLKIRLSDAARKSGTTTNIVYKEVLTTSRKKSHNART